MVSKKRHPAYQEQAKKTITKTKKWPSNVLWSFLFNYSQEDPRNAISMSEIMKLWIRLDLGPEPTENEKWTAAVKPSCSFGKWE